MSAIAVLRNEIGADWVHRLHVMGSQAGALAEWFRQVPAHAQQKRYLDELNNGHLEAEWRAREVIRLTHPYFDGEVNPLATWEVAVWWIGGGKVSRAMIEAGTAFALECGFDPQYAFIRSLPANAEEFVEVRGITLVRAEWVLPGYLVAAAGGMWSGLPAVGKQTSNVMEAV